MKCPGQDTQQWKPEDIFDVICPRCGKTVEFFKDEATRTCKICGTKIVNPKIDFGCAAYCSFAEQCLKEVPPELLQQRKDLFKERIACEMRRYFGNDQKRIQHAESVACYAERIGREVHADMAVVIAAAYLHDIGIHEAEQRYGSSAAPYQEELGPLIARKILQESGANRQMIDEVCDIIAHLHHPRREETANFKALYDADLIVNLQEGDIEAPRDREKLRQLIEMKFLTESGKRAAEEMFLQGDRSREAEGTM
ncbi:MAG: HD domain-containing protein [Desulfobacterota bacterium]|nr:HD domain-containing protein [Thermodesulfobacteriota bacterium]